MPEWIGRCSARGTPLSGSSLSGAAQELGWVGVTPFLTLAFLARPPVIPSLELTDRGGCGSPSGAVRCSPPWANRPEDFYARAHAAAESEGRY